jgi:hypothetical protein
MFERLKEFFENIMPHDEECHTATVAKGEGLSQVAERVTGDANRWMELRDANPDRHWDENYTLQIDERLKIPNSWVH